MKNDKLELLALANKFTVSKNGNSYHILHNDADLSAEIDGNMVDIIYSVTGVYNNGSDYADIDMQALEELKKFCELMIKE